MPNAFLAQSTVQMKKDAAKAAKLTNKFPIGQILYFHEQRLLLLEKKTPQKSENNTALLKAQVEHLEKMCQQLVREMQQLKLAESENNVQLEVSEENDSAEEEEENAEEED